MTDERRFICEVCGEAEIPDGVDKELVRGHWLVRCAACDTLQLVPTADSGGATATASPGTGGAP